MAFVEAKKMKSRWLLLLLPIAFIGLRSWAVTEITIHSFAGESNSAYPYGGLVFDAAGNAYGTAEGGGQGYGTIYQLVPSQSGWTATILYSFDSLSGANPSGPLIFDSAGNLYGTAYYGGSMPGICAGSGCGTAFELQRVNEGWHLIVLYTFTGGLDGDHPGPSLVFDKSGNLFGTTFEAGSAGYGTVFELSQSGGVWTESTVYAFLGYGDGASPVSGLTPGAAGTFYGTTEYGGSNNLGTVYQLTKTNAGWEERVLHSFTGTDGEYQLGGSLLFRGSALFGTTNAGGEFDQGTTFSLSRSNNAVIETVLCSFNGTDGGFPYSGVVADSVGNLYGTTVFGGSTGNGAIFTIRNVNGTWRESVLHNFTGSDGNQPIGTPTLHNGALFGSASGGGEWDAGVDWEVTAN
jgi:uncharacterized repeat protein (TIGR03803 family)